MKKIMSVVLVLILVLGVVGCTQEKTSLEEMQEGVDQVETDLEKVVEENENIEEETKPKENEEVEVTEETTKEVIDFSDYTINDNQIKVTHPNMPVENVIDILAMSTNEFIETFSFQNFESNPKQYNDKVGTIGGSYYFIVEKTAFYLSLGAIFEDYDKKSVSTIVSQYNSKNELTIEVNGDNKIDKTNFVEDIKEILGDPSSITDSYDEYGEEKLGNSLNYEIKGFNQATGIRTEEENIVLSFLTDVETEQIISISLY